MKEPFISKLHLKKRRKKERVNVIHIRKKKKQNLKKVNYKQKKKKNKEEHAKDRT